MPKNVTQKDIDAEDHLLEVLVKAGAIQSWRKLNDGEDYAHIDAEATTKKGVTFLLELRNRSGYTLEKITNYGGPFINLHKLWPSIHMARTQGKSLYFAVLYAGDVVGLYDIYNVVDDAPADRCNVKPERPQRNESRNQDVNDSCFAISLGKPELVFPER